MSTTLTQSLVDAVGRHFEEALQPDIRALFHEAYQEAMAEGKAMLKQRMLAALLDETSQHVASPTPATKQPTAPQPVAELPAAEQPVPAAPTARIHALPAGSESAVPPKKPAWEHEPILEPSSAPPPPVEPDVPETVQQKTADPAPSLPPPVRDDDLDGSLRGQIEYIRRQISRNEKLLSQLRPFLATAGN